MKTHSNILRLCAISAIVFLMGSAGADPIGDVFAANRDLILSQKITTVANRVFTVGKAKSSRKAGEEIGYSKAAMFAYGNIEFLNFNRAEWPEDITADEKKAVWRRYREQCPAKYTLEGGMRVHRERSEGENYLVVLSFPDDAVKTESAKRCVLSRILSGYRDEVAKALAAAGAKEGEASAGSGDQQEAVQPPAEPDNRPTVAVTYDDLVEALMDGAGNKTGQGEAKPTGPQPACMPDKGGYSESGGIKINNTLDESLML